MFLPRVLLSPPLAGALIILSGRNFLLFITFLVVVIVAAPGPRPRWIRWLRGRITPVIATRRWLPGRRRFVSFTWRIVRLGSTWLLVGGILPLGALILLPSFNSLLGISYFSHPLGLFYLGSGPGRDPRPGTFGKAISSFDPGFLALIESDYSGSTGTKEEFTVRQAPLRRFLGRGSRYVSRSWV